MAQTLTVGRTVAERRRQRAEVLAADFVKWIACTTRFAGDVRGASTVFAIPSQSVLGKYHLATSERCGCWDAQRRSGHCKHMLAIRIVLTHLGLIQRPSWADVVIEEEEIAA
jgi:hypothetical protein